MDATTLNNAIILDGVMAIALMDILLWLDINNFFLPSNSFIIIRIIYVSVCAYFVSTERYRGF